MILNALPDICRQLMTHGAPSTRPIAAVQHGTLATQQVLTGTLADLPAKVAASGFTSPSLLIVGDAKSQSRGQVLPKSRGQVLPFALLFFLSSLTSR